MGTPCSVAAMPRSQWRKCTHAFAVRASIQWSIADAFFTRIVGEMACISPVLNEPKDMAVAIRRPRVRSRTLMWIFFAHGHQQREHRHRARSQERGMTVIAYGRPLPRGAKRRDIRAEKPFQIAILWIDCHAHGRRSSGAAEEPPDKWDRFRRWRSSTCVWMTVVYSS